MKKKKVLFFGAGVLGSLYAAMMHNAGFEVALAARGARYRDLKEHGVVLKQFDTGEVTTTPVRILEGMPEEEYFDYCIVLVQKNQLTGALEALKVNKSIPCFVFMNNTAEGPEEMIEALGRERVMMGHANAGGERDGHMVLYMITEKMTLGELDGRVTERLEILADMFNKSGVGVEFSKNIDSWKRYHVALAVPFAFGMYATNTCNLQMAENREVTALTLQGIREAFDVLKKLDYPVEPPKLRWVFAIPSFILTSLFQRVLKTKIADIGMARHLRNAREEMDLLISEFDLLIEKSGLETPDLERLRKLSSEAKSNSAKYQEACVSSSG